MGNFRKEAMSCQAADPERDGKRSGRRSRKKVFQPYVLFPSVFNTVSGWDTIKIVTI